MEDNNFDVIVVGGGIVGVATAYRIQQSFPRYRICLLEKESQLAYHQTGRNSGVIHSGIYYKPGSYKAKNCVDGRRQLVQFAREQSIEHDICGKIIVATRPEELTHLERIYERGLANGVEDVEKITAAQISEIEPHCRGIAGIRVGCTGIIDFRGTTEKLAALVQTLNPASRVLCGRDVRAVRTIGDNTELATNAGIFHTRYVVYCGGLQADRLAKRESLPLDMRILGFRGDYFELSERGKHKVRNLIYPVPDPQFPFLGVHFTRMVDGTVECGPNAVFVFKREGYGKTDFSLRDTTEALTYPGTWKFFAKHWRYGLEEYRRAFSKKLFLEQLKRLIPSLEMADLAHQRSGVRAMALSDTGEMIDDFKIEYGHRSVHVLNAPSPAATACLAIGTEVATNAAQRFGWSA